MNTNTVIVGAQWGDEGKGKIIDILSQQADYVVRYQGGSNAGHTVVADGKHYVFHLIPSGILHAKKICCIGNGVTVDPESLLAEISALAKAKIGIAGRLKISHLAHVIFPYHKVLDELRESKRTHRIGTTGRGIGPCYADKINRCGIRMVDLLNPSVLAEKLRDTVNEKNEIMRKVYGRSGFDAAELIQKYTLYGRTLAPYVADVSVLLHEAAKAKRRILFEGAQGTFLDIDFGTYPFVTSSSTVSGGACIGAGVPPSVAGTILGVTKAYTTRVGEGPFPTEFDPAFAQVMRDKGSEFGATTGRPRRCGWLDAVMVKEAVRLNGITEIALTKLDVLDGLKTIKIAVAYKYKGKTHTHFPYDYEAMHRVSPVYIELPGWDGPLKHIRDHKKLPRAAKNYIRTIEKILETKVSIISVGSSRDDTIFVC